MAEDIIAGKIEPGDTVYVIASDQELVIGTEDLPEENAAVDQGPTATAEDVPAEEEQAAAGNEEEAEQE